MYDLVAGDEPSIVTGRGDPDPPFGVDISRLRICQVVILYPKDQRIYMFHKLCGKIVFVQIILPSVDSGQASFKFR